MRHKTLVLTQRDVARLVDMRIAIRVARGAFEAMARGETVMPPKVYLPLPGGGDFRAMPAFLARPPACGIKWVNVHPRNRARGLPTVMAVIVMNDPATGVPLAVLDGLLVTKLRTAAAAAVAAKALARRESRVVGLIGCGAQADAQVEALAEVFRLSRVKVWGLRLREAQRFCRRMRRRLPGVVFEPCATPERCARGTDILVTVTPSRRPLIRRAWLAPGTHVNAIGADAPGKQELDPAILRAATVVVDERTQAIHGGELNVPVRRGQFDPRRIHASLGEVLIGRRPGRRSADELTVFDSTGLAIHDVALGAAILRRAKRLGVGRRLRIFGDSH
ncbi:MAG: ornithine cyclodeaminase family protein [Candidatus Omnitrophica bacterium]|nr:ornithine cyclodeaminase family protein [Candidatus Omnitrophota bacterium]